MPNFFTLTPTFDDILDDWAKDFGNLDNVKSKVAAKIAKKQLGEVGKITVGGVSGWHDCWRCGKNFESKKSWKVWPQGPTCLSCRHELEAKKQKQYDVGADVSNFEAAQTPLPKDAPMKKGEIRKLAKATSALWTDQWLVMGTAKAPYVISKKQKTGEWQCSCPDWSKHVPREDCKHILKVKMQEGILVTKEKNIFSAPVVPVQNQGMALPAPKGRKFR